MKKFRQIHIQSKDDKEDFRSFCYCADEFGDEWVLRGYGSTAGEAATDAWEKYQAASVDWENYGYILDKPSFYKKST